MADDGGDAGVDSVHQQNDQETVAPGDHVCDPEVAPAEATASDAGEQPTNGRSKATPQQSGRRSHQSLEERLRSLSATLLAIAKRRVPAGDAEDMVQEAMLVIIDNLERLETPGALLAFADGVLRNKIGNFYSKRDRRKQVVLSIGFVPEQSCFLDADTRAEKLQTRVLDTVVELGLRSPKCRDLLLGLAEGETHTDLCTRLKIPLENFDKHVFRCRQGLRTMIPQFQTPKRSK